MLPLLSARRWGNRRWREVSQKVEWIHHDARFAFGPDSQDVPHVEDSTQSGELSKGKCQTARFEKETRGMRLEGGVPPDG